MTIPGVCWRTTHGSRAVGIVSSASREKLADSVVDRVSTTGLSPLTVESLKLGDHTVVAALPDRPAESRVVRLASPGERIHVVLNLLTPVLSSSAKPSEDPKPREAAKSAAPVRKGRLTLDTVPWTHVLLQGRKIGDTPLIEAQLPAGKYNLTLVNEEKGVKSLIEVEIEPGKTTVKKLRF